MASPKQDVGKFTDALFSKNYISEADRDFAYTCGIPPDEKARRLASAVINRVKQNPDIFRGFLELELLNDHFRMDFTKKLRDSFENQRSQLSPTAERSFDMDSLNCSSTGNFINIWYIHSNYC